MRAPLGASGPVMPLASYLPVSKPKPKGEYANNDTFKAIAEEWKEKKRSGWAPYYLQQIERGMKADIYPRIGRLPIRAVPHDA